MNALVLAILISWTAPTERESGDVLAESEIGGYLLQVTCSDGVKNFDTNETSYSVANIYSGCTAKVKAYDTNSLYSVWSNEITLKSSGIDSIRRGGIR